MMTTSRVADATAPNDDPKARAMRGVLRTLNATSPEIEASAVISGDGLMLASVLGEGVDVDRFGAMCASLLALADRAAQEISRGTLKQVLIEGDKGTMLLVYAGTEMVLAVAAKPKAQLGMVFIEAKKTAQKLAEGALTGFNW